MATAAVNGISSASASAAQNQLTEWLLGTTAKGDMFVGRKKISIFSSRTQRG
jgi:hypothetical protein